MKKKTRLRLAMQDYKQRMLALDQPNGIESREKPKPLWTGELLGDVLCPFCLYKDKPIKFAVSTKRGYHRSRAKCPECEKEMLIESLTAKMTPEEFAEWVYKYPYYSFWKRCIFHTFCDRLKRLGWSYAFWGKYKSLKKPSYEDQYEQYKADMKKEYI